MHVGDSVTWRAARAEWHTVTFPQQNTPSLTARGRAGVGARAELRKTNDAKQPIAAENPRLTHTYEDQVPTVEAWTVVLAFMRLGGPSSLEARHYLRSL